jgi:3-oxoacyl-[acyl-carrier protein] reductase
MDMRSKAVVITGAGSGIGREIAHQLARRGANVALLDIEILASMRPEVLDKLTAPVPLKRLGLPEEIANAVVFIFENDFFTGRCLDVDGGLRL